MVGDSKLVAQKLLPEGAAKVRNKPFVNCCEKYQQRATTGIEMPIRYRPFNLGPIGTKLVSFMITIVVKLFADARHDK